MKITLCNSKRLRTFQTVCYRSVSNNDPALGFDSWFASMILQTVDARHPNHYCCFFRNISNGTKNSSHSNGSPGVRRLLWYGQGRHESPRMIDISPANHPRNAVMTEWISCLGNKSISWRTIYHTRHALMHNRLMQCSSIRTPTRCSRQFPCMPG